MSLTKPQLTVIGVAAGIVLIFALILAGIIPGLKEEPPTQTQATLNLWTVFGSQQDYAAVIGEFNKIYPNIRVNVRTFSDFSEYESTVLNALAAGAGPDVFMIQNGSLAKEIGKLAPVPADKYSLNFLRSQFPQVVETDFVSQGQIYALPPSIDTLALVYNRDLFNQAGAALPPQTWEEFISLIPRFIKLDQAGRFTAAGAAIGGSKKSIANAADILDLIRLQKGSVLLSDQAGQEALNFYIQFANAASASYTWNDTLQQDLEMFAAGKLVMMFGYAADVRALKSRNPFLNIAVAPAPQFAGVQQSVAYPNYRALAVARQSRNQGAAWDLILYLVTNFDPAAVGQPPALNTRINQKVNDPELGVFSRQALIAKSWPKTDALRVSDILSGAIENVITGRLSVKSALDQAKIQYDQIAK